MPKMKKTWRLPWCGKMVPHATIDIIRQCNISCKACYKSYERETPRALLEIEIEIDQLKRKRHLTSIGILGGEATLHPELLDIVAMIHGKGLESELITNGYQVDSELCDALKKAGLTSIFFHIEPGQIRPDLKNNASLRELNQLRIEKVKIASNSGLEVGLALTAFPGHESDVRDVVDFMLETAEVSYLMITLYRDNSGLRKVYGDVENGLLGDGVPPPYETRSDNYKMKELMQKDFDLEPFAFVGASGDSNEPRWLSYLVGAVYDNNRVTAKASLKASLLEKTAMLFFKLIKGKYPMHIPHNHKKMLKQLKINMYLGGNKKANRKLIRAASTPGAEIRAKRIFFQNLAELNEYGEIVHCQWCPDALLRNGNLVPICIADKAKAEIPLFKKFPNLRGSVPYVSIAELPSPIQQSKTISNEFNIGCLFIKRDDLTGLEYGSNKVRKLEFILADALRKKSKRVVTFGFAGSNHTLATAIYAKKLKLKMSAMLLPQYDNGTVRDNLLASLANNANLYHFKNIVSIYIGTFRHFFISFLKEGRLPYSIPPGGSSPYGVIAYINAALELREQIESGELPEPDSIYIPFGSMGSAAGLSIGLEIAGLKSQIKAIRVVDEKYANYRKLIELITATVKEISKTVPDFKGKISAGKNVTIIDEFIGEGYAYPTDKGKYADITMQKHCGIKLSSTYSSKAFAALINDAEAGKLVNKRVLFWNTFNNKDLSPWIDSISPCEALVQTQNKYSHRCDTF